MRRLSEALGRGPAVLYRHLPNKAAALDGVAETALEQLAVDTSDPNRVGQLRTIAHNFRSLAIAHPNVFPLLVTRPLSTPLGQRPPGGLHRRRAFIGVLVGVILGLSPCQSAECPGSTVDQQYPAIMLGGEVANPQDLTGHSRVRSTENSGYR